MTCLYFYVPFTVSVTVTVVPTLSLMEIVADPVHVVAGATGVQNAALGVAVNVPPLAATVVGATATSACDDATVYGAIPPNMVNVPVCNSLSVMVVGWTESGWVILISIVPIVVPATFAVTVHFPPAGIVCGAVKVVLARPLVVVVLNGLSEPQVVEKSTGVPLGTGCPTDDLISALIVVVPPVFTEVFVAVRVDVVVSITTGLRSRLTIPVGLIVIPLSLATADETMMFT